ncbi:MAG: EVE domain-containing protein [Myxococcales bacterium]|nr:EVE domain-containing protein [Myxococcales bacterium]
MRYWLMKSEPNAFSFDDLLAAKGKRTHWDGIRNYQARNFMRDEMAVGDLVLFYHSNAKPPGVAGIARVCSESYPDPTQFDRKSKYYDEKATKDEPRWSLVDVEHVETFDALVSLDELKSHADELDGLMVIKRGIRFSVQPVDAKHFAKILKLAGARTKAR